jgi:hypothetical protein
MARFDRFADLPEWLQVEVWTYASHESRVVGVFEEHDPISTGEIYNGHATILMSTTRPPAILSGSHESRAVALTIYKAMDEGVRTEGSRLNIPIYVNPTVDIIYRGRKSCQKGNAFHIKLGLPLGNPGTNAGPLCITGKLAVGLTAVTTKDGTSNDSQILKMPEYEMYLEGRPTGKWAAKSAMEGSP